MQALQVLNSEYAQAVTYLQSTRAKHLDARGIQFPVGMAQRDMSACQQSAAETKFGIHARHCHQTQEARLQRGHLCLGQSM